MQTAQTRALVAPPEIGAADQEHIAARQVVALDELHVPHSAVVEETQFVGELAVRQLAEGVTLLKLKP